MAEIDPVILQLRADVNGYLADLRQTTTKVDSLLGTQEARQRRLESEMKRSNAAIGVSFRALAASLASYFTGRELMGLADSFTRLQNNLRVAGQEGERLAAVQASLLDISSRYGTDVETLSGVFLKASLAQNELGASTQQIIDLNEIVAASLKITGTSAEEARGALLQLGQALGSDIVRGEEFNSLLENALPLVQAAARGIDRFEGSVARLRKAVVDGNITSREFFEGILKGGTKTLEDAEKATLTLSGGFTALKSALMVYIGEADKANGVSAALSEAMKSLADNLDTLIPALAAIAIALGVRYAVGAAAAAKATIALGAAATGTAAAMGVMGASTFALQARLAGAATTGEALAFALGGVGKATVVTAAIVAFGAGLYYVIRGLQEASEELDRFEASADQAGKRADQLEKRLRDAGVKIDSAGDGATSAAGKMNVFARSMQDATDRARELIKELRVIEFLEINNRRKKLQRERKLQTAQQYDIDPVTGQAIKLPGAALGSDQSAKLQAIDREIADLDRQERYLTAAAKAGVNILDDEPSSSPAATAPGTPEKPKPKPKGRIGPTAEEIEDRFHGEMASLMAQYNSARASMALSAEEQAEYEFRNLELARIRTKASIKADKDYSDLQKEELLARLEAVAEEERRAVEFNMRRQLEQEAQGLADERFRAEQDQLRVQYDLAGTQAERKELALRIVDLEQRHAEALLESVIASETASNADKERARIALDALQSIAGARRESASRANETGVERYLRHLDKTPEQINEAVDSIKIDGLEALNDGLVDAIRGVKDLGDVFESVTDQIIADLLRIAIQRAIVQPLANAIFGGVAGGFGGGSGGGGALGLGSLTNGRLPGRASGGYVQAGTLYRVNEGSSPGRVEGFVPEVNGNIIPLGRMNAPSGGSRDSGTATVRLELSGDIDARIQQVSGPVAIEVVRASMPATVDLAAREAMARSRRPRL